MKKLLFRILLIVALSILLLTAASAEGKIYQVPEMGLEITIPSGFYVATKETPESDPVFSMGGTSKTDLIAHFEKNGIYLNAFPSDSYEELVVTMSEGIMEDFNLLSDIALEILATSFDELYAEQNVEVASCSLYQHSQAKFVKLYYYDTVNVVWGLQYFTTYNTKAMNFTLRSYEGEITTEQESFMKTLVDSIQFDTEPVLPEPGVDTEAFLYEDSDSGLRFMVPANWVETKFTEEREFLDVGFESTKEAGHRIYFASMDLWEELPETDKIGIYRRNIDNSAVTRADIAEMYGIAEKDVYIVDYNGVAYYRMKVPYESDLLGLSVTVTMTQLIHIRDGWMYLFQYGGSTDNEAFDDFKALMNSVEYPGAKAEKYPTRFLYVDHEADVSFTVPGNWEKGQLVDIENASGSEFYSEDYPESYITYWSSDLWEQQTDEEKEENPRSVINNADVTYGDIAEMYELKKSDVSEVVYNGAEYFKVVTDAETAPVTQLVRFDNGWMYEFEFVGTEVDAAYADFEKLLDSVKYPNRAEAVPEKEEKSEAKTDKGSYSMIVVALAILAAAGLVVLVIGIIAENRNKQRQEIIDQRIVVVCKDCGHKLSGDSQFCPYCGAKIRKKDRLL